MDHCIYSTSIAIEYAFKAGQNRGPGIGTGTKSRLDLCGNFLVPAVKLPDSRNHSGLVIIELYDNLIEVSSEYFGKRRSGLDDIADVNFTGKYLPGKWSDDSCVPQIELATQQLCFASSYLALQPATNTDLLLKIAFAGRI